MPSTKVFPAATVVVVRDNPKTNSLEVLLLKRASSLVFGSNQWVFPGGRIESDDNPNEQGSFLAAAKVAAARETSEEAGLVVDPEDMQFFAHWTTPPHMPKRFATWFFMSPVSPEQQVVIDEGEIVEFRWYIPQQALTELSEGSIEMMPPTFVTLTQLQQFESAQSALADARDKQPFYYEPCYIKDGDTTHMLYQGDAGYNAGDAGIAGNRHRVTISPAGWSYLKSSE